jgi:hypothetical protein
LNSAAPLETRGLKVKIFFETRHRKIEEAVQTWLDGEKGSSIVAISQSSSQSGHMMTIWYYPSGRRPAN